MGNKLNLLNFLLGSDKHTLNNEAEESQSLFNPSAKLLTPQDLKLKRSIILSRANNDPELERDFRRTCALYENQKFASNRQLERAYQKYVEAYHHAISLYIWEDATGAFLHAFNTEKESSQAITLNAPTSPSTGACIAKLPNCELFCYGERKNTGITLIFDKDYKIKVLPSGMPSRYSSAIYFNKNVYCFGGMDKHYRYLALSARFDLNENRWFKLALMPAYEKCCHSVIVNRNILISGFFGSNLLLYSVDLDSFSIISYDFAKNSKKLLINVERLYLIECKNNGFVYESEAGNEFSWNQIARSWIGNIKQAYCLYNKDQIYIISAFGKVENYSFDLTQNKMLKLK